MTIFCRNLAFAALFVIVAVFTISAIYPMRSSWYYGLMTGAMGGAVGMAALIWHLTSFATEQSRSCPSRLVYGYVLWRSSMLIMAATIVMVTIQIFRSLDPIVILIVSASAAGMSILSFATLIFALFQREEEC